MRKLLLSLLSLALLAPSASAQQKIQFNAGSLQKFTDNRAKIQSRAETSSFDYKYFGDLADGVYPVGFNNQVKGMEIASMLVIPPEMATELAGAKITAINFCTGYNSGIIFQTKEGSVWVAQDRDNSFWNNVQFPATFDVTEPANINKTQLTMLTVNLTTPYTIEAGSAVIVGATSILGAKADQVIITDNNPVQNSLGSLVAMRQNSTANWGVYDVSSYGSVVVSATIEGDNLPQDKVEISALDVTQNAGVNENFSIHATIRNNAANAVNSVEYEYSIGNSAPVVKQLDLSSPLEFNGESVIEINDAKSAVCGCNEISFEVTKVNGVANKASAKAESKIIILPDGVGFHRNVVIEEYTGNWCAYCPRGIYALDVLKESAAPGTFIPVAIHGNDPMEAESCYPLLSLVGSFPTMKINRGVYEYVPMIASETVGYYNAVSAIPAIAEVKAEASLSQDLNNIDFKVKSTFATDIDKATYRLAFMIVEDDVVDPETGEMYYQINSLSGGKTGQFGPWEGYDQYHFMKFQDVARLYVGGLNGLENTVPASVKAGQAYEYSGTLDVNSSAKLVNDISNASLVVYLLDSTNGALVNATMVKKSDIQNNGAGVNDIIADSSDAPVEYFNLQGVRVAKPSNGIFIKRQGLKTSKVIVK